MRLEQAKVSKKTLAFVQDLRKRLWETKEIDIKLEAKKTQLVLKTDELSPRWKKYIKDQLASGGIDCTIKDNYISSGRGCYTNTLIAIKYN